MSALVVDTSIWVEVLRGRDLPELDEAVRAGVVVLSPLVVAELLSASIPARRRSALVSFLLDLPLHPTPFEHWARVGGLRERLAHQGIAVSIPDAHVAQCALDVAGRLWSADRVFARIAAATGLQVVSGEG